MLLLATLLLGAAPRGKETARERTLASLDALADDLDGLLHAAERTNNLAFRDGDSGCFPATNCMECNDSRTDFKDLKGFFSEHKCHVD